MFAKVLAASDQVEVRDPAVSTAAQIAKQKKGSLVVLHVMESGYTGKYRNFVKHYKTGEEIVSSPEYEETLKAVIASSYGDILRQLEDCEIKVMAGFPWEQILRVARWESVGLIVLGPHSGRAAERGVARRSEKIGSTVEAVVTHERCPVMIVNRPATEGRLGFKKVMVCVDFSKSCESALQFTARLASQYGSAVSVFHMMAAPDPSAQSESDQAGMLKDVQARVEACCKESLNGITREYVIRAGNAPQEEILNYAKEKDIDLIVMGSHTKEKGDRWYVGSAVEEVSARSSCPVAVVTDPGALRSVED